jgi:hypothetical protein
MWVMARARGWIALAAGVALGCGCRSEEPVPASTPEVHEPAPGAELGSGDGATRASEHVAVEDGADGGEDDDAREAPGEVAGGDGVGEGRTLLTLSESGSALIEARGLPAISADGMHVAVLAGDEEHGPLSLRILRVDGSVLLERPLLEEGETARAAGGDNGRRQRRLAQRLAPAQRVIDKAEMRALTRRPSTGAEAPVSEDKGVVRIALPGFSPASLPMAALGGAACATVSIAALFADEEHGVVVAEVRHQPVAGCDVAAKDWRVFALNPAP